MKLTNNDKILLENSYKNFLYNIKKIFLSKQKSAIDCYKILCEMLRNGQFCIENKINFDVNFNYLKLENTKYLGLQVIYGICCCRHVSEFINDIMLVLGFNTSLYYVYIDDNEIWHVCDPINANHIAILLIEDSKCYILDPMNNFILKIEDDKSLIALDLDTPPINDVKFKDFKDENIKKIGKILKKYYHLQRIGINHIYDYN